MLTAKFVFYDLGGEGVSDQNGNIEAGKTVPCRNRLIEADNLEFKKVILIAGEPYTKHITEFMKPIWEISKLSDDKDQEVVILSAWKDGELEYFIARNCEMYIMNSNGATIDRCRVN